MCLKFQIESLLSSLGQAIGLGNIWRFPTVAYQNGGTSFLIVYIICAFVFAVPAIHMEFALGQYAAKSPPAVFRRIMPALEGWFDDLEKYNFDFPF